MKTVTKKQTAAVSGKVKCKLFRTCQRKQCLAMKKHRASDCTCRCSFTPHAGCVPIEDLELGAQDYMLSEDEAAMQVPGAAAAR